MAVHLVKKTFGEVIKEYGLVTVGLLAYSLGWTIFLLPNNLVGGGVSGFAAILRYAYSDGIYLPCHQCCPIVDRIEDFGYRIWWQDYLRHHDDICLFECLPVNCPSGVYR